MTLLSSEPANVRIPVLEEINSPSRARLFPLAGWIIPVFLTLALGWCYWPALGTMVDLWWNDPQNSHGFLVPVFAVVLLWMRWGSFTEHVSCPSFWGLVPILAGVALRLIWARVEIRAIDCFSLLPTLAGLVLLVGGWAMLRWSWPAICFLGFMLPLPDVIGTGLSMPLREIASMMSTYLLETLGYPAIADGNYIFIDEVTLEVARACSGLGMLTTFFAMATALALVVRRGWIESAVFVASAVPIAVLANVLRITATGVTHVAFGADAARLVMHDLAGYLMMLLAVGLLWLELWLIDRLFPKVDETNK